MTPYSRFRLISNSAAAMLVAGALCAFWPTASGMIAAAAGDLTAAYSAATVLAAFAAVIAWIALTEAVFPALFQLSPLRRAVLGAAYVEGTWIQAEHGPSGTERLTVLQIKPVREGFDVSGYSLGRDGETESNRLTEFCKFNGTVLSYAYRSLMPDGTGEPARGSNELLFGLNRGAPRTFTGNGQMAVSPRRFAVEGVKVTKASERRQLRKLDQRRAVCDAYWNLLFGTEPPVAEDDAPPAIRRPIIVETARAFVERRTADTEPAEGVVVPRRRASDWRAEDSTPTADRIRARMLAEAARDEEIDNEEFDGDEDDIPADEDSVMMDEDSYDEPAILADEEEDDELIIHPRGRAGKR